jgi:drug/metabolite transporter (DMT)-like permease
VNAGPGAAPERLVPLALAGAIVAISFAAPLFKLADPTPPIAAAALRLAMAGAVLAPWVVGAARAGRLDRRVVRAAALGGLCYAVHFGAWVTSLTLTSVAASVTLVTATPLLLAAVAVVTGRDRPDARLWAALALATGGVALIGSNDAGSGAGAVAGDALALLGAAAMAAYLLIGRALGAALDPMAFNGISTAVGALLLAVGGLVAGTPPVPASWPSFGYLAAAALLPQVVGHSLLTWSLRHARPAVIGMATVGEPAGATALAWLWLGEPVPPVVAAGCVVTLAAVVLAVRRR